MPTLNYENVGALVEYDYLQGTITALYPEDDTADVTLKYKVVVTPAVPATDTTPAVEEVTEDKEEELTGVPIFYHCEKDSVARGNGAIEGAAAGFYEEDVVIVLRGINGNISLGKEYYVIGHYEGVRSCDSGIQFILSENIGSNRFLYWYDIDGVLLKTINLSDTLGTPATFEHFAADNRIHLVAASGDLNRLIVDSWVNSWRGYADDSDNYDFNFSGMWPVIISLESDAEIENAISYDYVKHYRSGPTLQSSFYFGIGGSQILTYDDKGACLDCSSIIGDGSHGRIVQRRALDINDDGTIQYEPSNHDEWVITAKCYSDIADASLMAINVMKTVEHAPSVFAESYIGVWNRIDTILNRTWFWEEGLTSGVLGDATKIILLSDQEFGRLQKVFCYDSKIYLFFDSGSYYPSVAISIKVYSFFGELLQTTNFPWYYIDRVSLLQFKGKPVFCFRMRDDWEDFGSEFYSDALIVDVETLEIIKRVTLPQKDTLSFNIPNVKDKMLVEVNKLRLLYGIPVIRPFPYEDNYTEPIKYVGYSKTLSKIMKNHLNWCVANKSFSHEGPWLDDHYEMASDRGYPYGYKTVGGGWGEVITGTSNSGVSGINEAISNWLTSPRHKKGLVQFQDVVIGWACVPTGIQEGDFQEWAVGPGAFLGLPDNYSTEWTTIENFSSTMLYGVMTCLA